MLQRNLETVLSNKGFFLNLFLYKKFILIINLNRYHQYKELFWAVTLATSSSYKMAPNIIAVVNAFFPVVDIRLIFSIADFFESNLLKANIREKVKSITILGHNRGTDKHFFNSGKFLVEFESLIGANYSILTRNLNFGGNVISIISHRYFLEAVLRNRSSYDEMKFGKSIFL